MTKAAITRQHLLDTALALFKKKGFEATTMRDIAKAAGMALGATYYHFPSKDAILFAFYDANQAATEARAYAFSADEPLRARLGRLFHDRLHDVAPNRALLGAIIPRHANPADPVSAFSRESADVRARAIALFDAAVAPENLPAPIRTMVARALWMAHLAILVYFADDKSAGQKKTHRLVDDLLDLAVPLVALARSPVASPLVEQLVALLTRADLLPRR
jgi:AcrR family transcriptional regulator